MQRLRYYPNVTGTEADHMLILGARKNEEIVIRLSDDVDPNLTVAELFAAGPLKIVPIRMYGSQHYDRFGIEAPKTFSINRQARWTLPVELIDT